MNIKKRKILGRATIVAVALLVVTGGRSLVQLQGSDKAPTYALMEREIARVTKQIKTGIAFKEHREAAISFVNQVADLEVALKGQNTELVDRLNEAASELKQAHIAWQDSGSYRLPTFAVNLHWEKFLEAASDARLIMKDPEAYKRLQEVRKAQVAREKERQEELARQRVAEQEKKRSEEEKKRAEEEKKRAEQEKRRAEEARKRADAEREYRSKVEQFLNAAAAGDTQTIGKLLSQGIYINSQNEEGKTALILAAQNGHAKAIPLLLEHKAHIDHQDKKGSTALLLAYKSRNKEAVEMLVRAEAAVDLANNFNESPLQLTFDRKQADFLSLLLQGSFIKTARLNDLLIRLSDKPGEEFDMNILKLLVERGANVNTRDKLRRTPMHLAAMLGRMEAVNYLWDRGADPASEDRDGHTPVTIFFQMRDREKWRMVLRRSVDVTEGEALKALLKAITKEDRELTEFLLQESKGLSTADKTAALEECVTAGHTELAGVLIEHGAAINGNNGGGKSPLFLALKTGQVQMIQKLLEKGADANAKLDGMDAPILIAIKAGQPELVDLLLSHGASIDAQDESGDTALTITCKKGNGKLVKLLSNKGVDINAKDPSGATPLMLATRSGNMETIAFLLSKGAKLNEQDNNGNTALMIACEKGDVRCARLFLKRGADWRVKNLRGESAQSVAVKYRQGEVLLLLSQFMK